MTECSSLAMQSITCQEQSRSKPKEVSFTYENDETWMRKANPI